MSTGERLVRQTLATAWRRTGGNDSVQDRGLCRIQLGQDQLNEKRSSAANRSTEAMSHPRNDTDARAAQ